MSLERRLEPRGDTLPHRVSRQRVVARTVQRDVKPTLTLNPLFPTPAQTPAAPSRVQRVGAATVAKLRAARRHRQAAVARDPARYLLGDCDARWLVAMSLVVLVLLAMVGR